uniref:Uncharacterized protein n=1 Tax=Arundo donax TaxID=35708 RepID=A0A0A9AG45_ARUDO
MLRFKLFYICRNSEVSSCAFYYDDALLSHLEITEFRSLF